METIEDIVADMRKRFEPYAKSDSNDARYVAYLGYAEFADRIEAAHKREREATCKESLEVGNAAKMREALENIKQEAETTCEYMDYPIAGAPGERGTCPVVDAEWIINECKSALSAPPRNCDLYATEEEAYQAYLKAMEDAPKESQVYFESWLFAKAKGDAQ